NVLEEGLEAVPRPDVARVFLHEIHAAQSAQRVHARGLRRLAIADALLDVHRNMRLNLLVEIIVQPPASEEIHTFQAEPLPIHCGLLMSARVPEKQPSPGDPISTLPGPDTFDPQKSDGSISPADCSRIFSTRTRGALAVPDDAARDTES